MYYQYAGCEISKETRRDETRHNVEGHFVIHADNHCQPWHHMSNPAPACLLVSEICNLRDTSHSLKIIKMNKLASLMIFLHSTPY